MRNFKRVKALRAHDGHDVGAEYELREDEATAQAGFGWVEVIGDVGKDDVHGLEGAGGKAQKAGRPKDG